jgi:hypothetical protein
MIFAALQARQSRPFRFGAARLNRRNERTHRATGGVPLPLLQKGWRGIGFSKSHLGIWHKAGGVGKGFGEDETDKLAKPWFKVRHGIMHSMAFMPFASRFNLRETSYPSLALNADIRSDF